MTEDNIDPQLPPMGAELATTPEANPAEVLKKRVYIGFAATMALGMAVAGAYISGRLFAKAPSTVAIAGSRTVSKNAVLHVQKPLAAPVVVESSPVAKTSASEAATPPALEKAAVQTPVSEKEGPAVTAKAIEPSPVEHDAQQGSVADVISPKHGEKYLQVAALGPNGTARYVPELRAGGVHALVAPGPETNIYRVVVGPFPDQPSLEKQRDALEAAGIPSILRVY